MTTDKSGRTSAGILLWRSREGRVEVLLAHQGGPFWVKKDIGHWTIPKGEVEPGEEFVAVAGGSSQKKPGTKLQSIRSSILDRSHRSRASSCWAGRSTETSTRRPP